MSIRCLDLFSARGAKAALSVDRRATDRLGGRRLRSGMSLVELLCVIALIGILIGMLLPAVQQVRESARNVSCQNNLRQLALAAQNYESAQGAFPPGTLGYRELPYLDQNDFPAWINDPSYPYYVFRNQNTSWLAAILPYVERSDLYDQLPRTCFDYARSYEDYRNEYGGPDRIDQIPKVAFVMRQQVALFLCPSDGTPEAELITGGTQPIYDTDDGVDGFLYFNVSADAATSNYAGCSGAYSGGDVPDPDMRSYDGIFGSRVRKRMSDVTDGTSQSIMAGEQLGWISARRVQSRSSWLFNGLARARSDLAWKSTQAPRFPGLELLGDQWFAYPAGFASAHPSVVNFAMIDGSVRRIPRSVDWQTLYSLAGIRDHNVIPE